MAKPYSSPNSVRYGAKPNSKEAKQVVLGQKILIYSMVGYLCAIPILVSSNFFLEGTSDSPVITPMFSIVLILGFLCLFASAICAAIGIFRMGSVLFPGSTRIIYALGVLIPVPLVGLIVMLVANSTASGYLKARGYKIGFFGAKR